jgi:NAD(P)H-dependent flavin oxidoreductase YrpB (nitropropane dioxygenase family)
MRTAVCETLGIDYPIFAFSHCRDVVVAVSRAGGMGVLGTTRYSPEQLEIELKLLDEQVQGRPYGVDMIFPLHAETATEATLARSIPQTHRDFIQELKIRFKVPPARRATENQFGVGDNLIITHERARALFHVALNHRIGLIASALGPPPPDVIAAARQRNIPTAGLLGRPEHAVHHVRAGVDIIIAAGTEAGGHSGEIGTMVLVPQVVSAVHPIPVLAAGGITDGRQIAAALALGAQGVWMGSVWLPTRESELHQTVKEKLVQAKSKDTVRSRCLTGKPVRQLRTPWVDAWSEPGAPEPLPAPLQGLLVSGALIGAFEHDVREVMGTPVGQGIGMVAEIQSVRDVIFGMLEAYNGAMERMVDVYRASGAEV